MCARGHCVTVEGACGGSVNRAAGRGNDDDDDGRDDGRITCLRLVLGERGRELRTFRWGRKSFTLVR